MRWRNTMRRQPSASQGERPGTDLPSHLHKQSALLTSWFWTSNLQSSHFCWSKPPFWRRWWHPTPVLLPGKSHGRRSPLGCSPWGLEESDRTERLHFHFSLSCIGKGNGNPLQCSCLENPRDREPGGLPSMGSHRVGHDWSDLVAAAAGNSHSELWRGKSIQGREGCRGSWRPRPQERDFSIGLSRKQQKEQQTKSHRAGWGLGPAPHLNRGNKSCLPGLHPQGCGGQGMLSSAGLAAHIPTLERHKDKDDPCTRIKCKFMKHFAWSKMQTSWRSFFFFK